MSKNDVNVNVKQVIQDKINEFVSTLTDLMEQSAQDSFRDKLSSVFGEMPQSKRAMNATKRNYQRKPCPVEGCENLAAPRYHQVCVEHGREFKAAGADGDKKRDLVIARANAPGGKWYQEAKEKVVQKRGRKAAAAA